MKSWIILALLVTVAAVFLAVGHSEETSDDFEDRALEEFYNDENDDTSENAVESVDETPSSGEEDDSEMLKRTPLWRRRRRRRRRGWFRKLKNKVKKHGRRICGLLKNSTHKVVKFGCDLVNGDEEYPRLSEDETFITEEEADELVKQGWLKQY